MQIGIRALDESLNLQKNKKPLIHCISNLVLSRELAEGILSYNGKPVISSSIEELSDITSKCDCLLINLEDLNTSKIDAIEKSIRIAKRKGISIILDLTGISLSFLRKESALKFLNRYNIDVIKGKIEEFEVLINNDKKSSNKDFTESKLKKDIYDMIRLKNFSKRYSTIVVVQFEDYYVTDGFSELSIESYHNHLENILGIEEILLGLISVGVATASNNKEIFRAVLVAIMTIAVSEKIVVQKNLEPEKNIWLKEYLLDEIKKIDSDKLSKLSKVNYFFMR